MITNKQFEEEHLKSINQNKPTDKLIYYYTTYIKNILFRLQYDDNWNNLFQQWLKDKTIKFTVSKFIKNDWNRFDYTKYKSNKLTHYFFEIIKRSISKMYKDKDKLKIEYDIEMLKKTRKEKLIYLKEK